MSNFDDEFTKEQPRLSLPKDRRNITEADHHLFKDFDFCNIWSCNKSCTRFAWFMNSWFSIYAHFSQFFSSYTMRFWRHVNLVTFLISKYEIFLGPKMIYVIFSLIMWLTGCLSRSEIRHYLDDLASLKGEGRLRRVITFQNFFTEAKKSSK